MTGIAWNVIICFIVCSLAFSSFCYAESAAAPAEQDHGKDHVFLHFQDIPLGNLKDNILFYVEGDDVIYYTRQDRTTSEFYAVKLEAERQDALPIGKVQDHLMDFGSCAAVGNSSYFYLSSFEKAFLYELNNEEMTIKRVKESLGDDRLIKVCVFDGKILNIANYHDDKGVLRSEIEYYCPEDGTSGIFYSGNPEISEIIAIHPNDDGISLFCKSSQDDRYLLQKLNHEKELLHSYSLEELPEIIFENRISDMIPVAKLIFLSNWNGNSLLLKEEDQALQVMEADQRLRMVRQQSGEKYPLFFGSESSTFYYYDEVSGTMEELATNIPSDAKITTAFMSDKFILALYLKPDGDQMTSHTIFAENPFQKTQEGE